MKNNQNSEKFDTLEKIIKILRINWNQYPKVWMKRRLIFFYESTHAPTLIWVEILRYLVDKALKEIQSKQETRKRWVTMSVKLQHRITDARSSGKYISEHIKRLFQLGLSWKFVKNDLLTRSIPPRLWHCGEWWIQRALLYMLQAQQTPKITLYWHYTSVVFPEATAINARHGDDSMMILVLEKYIDSKKGRTQRARVYMTGGRSAGGFGGSSCVYSIYLFRRILAHFSSY